MDVSPRATISVFVVSDVRFYREGLCRVLASTDQIHVLGAVGGTDESLLRIAELRPDVVLVDTAMPAGAWVARRFADALPDTKIVALDVPPAEEDLIVLVEAGVLGYVTREQSLDEVVAAILSVVREEMVCSARTRTLVAKRVRALAAELRPPHVQARLTARELEILHLIARGLSNKEIGRELRIERATVKNHVHNILDKLQVRTRMAAVAEMRLYAGAASGHSREGLAPVAASR
jgi:DNA-binding NarL/FixJ family response regulator